MFGPNISVEKGDFATLQKHIFEMHQQECQDVLQISLETTLSNGRSITEIFEVLKPKLLRYQNSSQFYKNHTNQAGKATSFGSRHQTSEDVFPANQACNLEAVPLPYLMFSCEVLPEITTPNISEIYVGRALKALIERHQNLIRFTTSS